MYLDAGTTTAYMIDYIEDMYNNPDIKVITMNTVYQRSRFDEEGRYRVIFVIMDR